MVPSGDHHGTPGHLGYTTQVPACYLVHTRDRSRGPEEHWAQSVSRTEAVSRPAGPASLLARLAAAAASRPDKLAGWHPGGDRIDPGYPIPQMRPWIQGASPGSRVLGVPRDPGSRGSQPLDPEVPGPPGTLDPGWPPWIRPPRHPDLVIRVARSGHPRVARSGGQNGSFWPPRHETAGRDC